MLGKTAAELHAKEFADFIASQDRAAMRGRRAMQCEITLPRPSTARAPSW